MSDVSIDELEKTFKEFASLWKGIYGAMMDNPRFVDPYVCQRQRRMGPKTNDIRRRRAHRILQKAHLKLAEISQTMKWESNDIYSRERKCRLCGLKYELLPEDDGRCPACIAGM